MSGPEPAAERVTSVDMNAWQSMETAPKNGASILVHCPGGYELIEIAKWGPDGAGSVGWVRARCVDGLALDVPPVCWMPLPALPNERETP